MIYFQHVLILTDLEIQSFMMDVLSILSEQGYISLLMDDYLILLAQNNSRICAIYLIFVISHYLVGKTRLKACLDGRTLKILSY